MARQKTPEPPHERLPEPVPDYLRRAAEEYDVLQESQRENNVIEYARAAIDIRKQLEEAGKNPPPLPPRYERLMG